MENIPALIIGAALLVLSIMWLLFPVFVYLELKKLNKQAEIATRATAQLAEFFSDRNVEVGRRD